MKCNKYMCLKFSALLVVTIYSIYQISTKSSNNKSEMGHHTTIIERNIVLAAVACGDRLYETLNMIKSAIMFSESKQMFVVLTEDHLIESFAEKVVFLIAVARNDDEKIHLLSNAIKIPAGRYQRVGTVVQAVRLATTFLTSEIDSVIYVDSDTLFLSPVETLWDQFEHMNSTQMAAMSPEHEPANIGYYNRFAMVPFYGPKGLNSGVILMNLTRMRDFHWEEHVVTIYKKYKLNMTLGDQDIINVIFYFHPDKLYVNSCRYNFRTDHCQDVKSCRNVEKEGIIVLHGSRSSFHSAEQTVFQAVYRAFEEFQLDGDLMHDFYQPLETSVELTTNTPCGTLKNAYLLHIKNYIDRKEKRTK